MTIIACDGKTIAADGQLACSGVVTTLSEEKIKVVDGRIYASAGLAALWGPLIEWHRNGAKPADIPKFGGNDNWLLVVVDADDGAVRIRQYCNECVLADDYPWPWAWGMHARIALGAMYAGKTAAQAVELVCERTVDAGGNIQVINIADALDLGTVRQAAE